MRTLARTALLPSLLAGPLLAGPALAGPVLAQSYSVSILDPDTPSETQPCASLDLSGTRAVFGSTAGAWVAERQPTGRWEIVAQLKLPSGVSVNADFGLAVAISNDLVAVGAQNHVPPGASVGTGAVFVYRRALSGAWDLDAQLFLSSTNQDRFGSAVALDGDRLVVGAPNARSVINPFITSGLVHVFDRGPGGNWALDATLDLPGLTSGSSLGEAVDVQGDRLLAGAPSNPLTARAVVYARNSAGNWIVEAAIAPSPSEAQPTYGEAVALDGSMAVVGSPSAPDPVTFSTPGDAFAYDRLPDGTWVEKEVPPPPGFGGGDFGKSVALDGNHMLIGTPGADIDHGNRGAAHLYRRDPGGSWTYVERFDPYEPSSFHRTGAAVALGGGWLLVAAPDETTTANEARVYVDYSYETSSEPAPIEYGVGTAGCGGLQKLSTNLPPLLGSSDFAFLADNAPPNAFGVGIVGFGQDLEGSDTLGLGVLLHVELLAAPTIEFAGTSDAEGTGRAALPLPAIPSLAGVAFTAQTLWVDPTCTSTPFGLSSSDALLLVIADG